MQQTMNSMLKKLRLKKEKKESEARQGLKKELFAFNYCVDQGFPSKPTAIAHEPYLDLIAIGTKAGDLRVYGAPGVEFVGNHASFVAVNHIFFIPKQGRLVTLCSDDSLHLWQIDSGENGIASAFSIVRSIQLDISKMKKTRACLSCDGETLYLGTDSGNVHTVDVNRFKLSSPFLQRDSILQNATEEFKLNSNSIDCLVPHPTNGNELLIGFGNGLIVLWNMNQRNPLITYHTTQFESLTFHREGKVFMSSHSDGGYNIWNAVEESRPGDHATIPNGPFPCKPITKIAWKTCSNMTLSSVHPLIAPKGALEVLRSTVHQWATFSNIITRNHPPISRSINRRIKINLSLASTGSTTGLASAGSTAVSTAGSASENQVIINREPFMILSGGMPRASHGEKHTVSVIQGQSSHVVLEFTTRVVDFIVLSASQPGDPKHSHDNPHTLLVLAEEELIAIDLSSPGWPVYPLPYLNSIHFSSILSATHVASVPSQCYESLEKLGLNQRSAGYSRKNWPIQGGKNLAKETNTHDLLVTGHENGCVCFWDVSTVSMRLVYKLSTAAMFGINIPSFETQNLEGEDEWPPFRKVGTYDPFSDDPQVGIQKIVLCCHSQTLVLAGTAGQVIVMDLAKSDRQQQIQVGRLDLLVGEGVEGFVWRGHESLTVSSSDIIFPAGFQPRIIVQVHPPAICTALAVHAPWQIFSVGTAHGFGLYDYAQNRAVFTRCTLVAPGDETVEGNITSPKTWRRSLRDSFRRLRQRRIPQQLSRRLSNASHRVSNSSLVRRMSGRSRSQSQDGRMNETREARPQQSSAEAAAPTSSTSETRPPESGDREVTSPKELEAKNKATTPSSPHSTGLPLSPSTDDPFSSMPQSPSGAEGVEMRSTDDLMTAHVRSLYIAATFLTSAQEACATLWVGTSSGRIYAHRISIPPSDKRLKDPVACVLGKEIHLKHRAPVISLSVVDRTMQPVSGLQDVEHERTKATDMTGGHLLVTTSEQQVKVFSLPSLAMVTKFKLPSQDSDRIKKSYIVNFTSKSDMNYIERDIMYMTQAGDVNILSLPYLRPQINHEQIKLDSSGVNASLFTLSGEGFFLNSPSEYLRASFSTYRVRKPQCTLPIPEGSRPVLTLERPKSQKQPAMDKSADQMNNSTAGRQSISAEDAAAIAAVNPSDPRGRAAAAAASESMSSNDIDTRLDTSQHNGYEYEGTPRHTGHTRMEDEHHYERTAINGSNNPYAEINDEHIHHRNEGADQHVNDNDDDDDEEDDVDDDDDEEEEEEEEEEEQEQDEEQDQEEEQEEGQEEEDQIIVRVHPNEEEQQEEASGHQASASASPVHHQTPEKSVGQISAETLT